MYDESKWFFLVFAMAFLISALVVLSGCAEKSEAVIIPTKCNANMPSAPLHTSNYIENLKNLAIYTQELECTLDYCINGAFRLKQCETEKNNH